MAKNKVTITGVGKARDNALKFLGNTFKDKEFLESYATDAENYIRNSTRARKDEYTQEPIKESTIKRRKSLIKSGNSFDQKIVSPKKSNLSMSGQLLESIKHRINLSVGEIVLYLNPYRKPYKGVKGQDLETKTNTQINRDLEKQGRKFFFISNKLQALLESKIAAQLRKKLALYNKVVRKLS